LQSTAKYFKIRRVAGWRRRQALPRKPVRTQEKNRLQIISRWRHRRNPCIASSSKGQDDRDKYERQPANFKSSDRALLEKKDGYETTNWFR